MVPLSGDAIQCVEQPWKPCRISGSCPGHAGGSRDAPGKCRWRCRPSYGHQRRASRAAVGVPAHPTQAPATIQSCQHEAHDPPESRAPQLLDDRDRQPRPRDTDSIPPGVNWHSWRAGLSFVERFENVVLLGPPGDGKTHFAIALGVKPVVAENRCRVWSRLTLIATICVGRWRLSNSLILQTRDRAFRGEQWQLYLDRKTHPSRWIPWAASCATRCRRRRTALIKCCTVILIPS